MNSRERILAAIDHQPVDRIPTDIWATPEVWKKLNDHFGPGVDVCEVLHIDCMGWIGADYIGPVTIPPEGESANYWGMRYRKCDYESGSYDEQIHCPLAGARSIKDLDRYAWPQADWFDYGKMSEKAALILPRKAVKCGYMALFYFHNQLRGLEQSLIDPLEDPEFTHELLNRISKFFYEHHRRMFQAANNQIDIAEVTDDFGNQTGPMISLNVFREFYKPHMKRFIDLCHEFKIKVFHHDDGSCRMFIPDLVEMGIDILNPIQWTCPGMDMAELKRDFGKRLCFHGAIENQRILPFGTSDEVRAEVRHCIDALASDGTGYILASCHNIQPVSPIENIIAMYDEAWKYGKR